MAGDDGQKDHSFTKAGNMRRSSISIDAKWVRYAWEEIDPTLIQRGFKKCCLSNAMDGSEDDVLFLDEELGESYYRDDQDDDDNDLIYENSVSEELHDRLIKWADKVDSSDAD